VLSDALDDLINGGLSSIVAHAVAYVVRAPLRLLAADCHSRLSVQQQLSALLSSLILPVAIATTILSDAASN
jgi:hypothetical protein